jgi:hypothetical protein
MSLLALVVATTTLTVHGLSVPHDLLSTVGQSIEAPLRGRSEPTLRIQNVTASMGPSEPSWVSGPKNRGTLDLIVGCLTALFLCVWTALHLNVHPHPGVRRYCWRNVRWMVMAIFLPEVVLGAAWGQYREMREVRRKINAWGATGQVRGTDPLLR